MEGHFVERIAAIRKVYACQRNYTLPILSITSSKKFILFYWPFIHTSKEVLSCTTVKAALQKFLATKLAMRPQARRLSRKAACAPKRLQNHQRALSRTAEHQAFRDTAFSILTRISVKSWSKSLIVQWWILGV